jgi:DNA-binding response OmpR family regulator
MIEEAVRVKTLAVLPSREDQVSLSAIFRRSNWDLYLVPDLKGMRKVLDGPDGLAPGVVISDCSPPDGNWQEVLWELDHLPLPPPLIVSSRLADERLWAEVLNCGGYDVLSTPFRREELLRAVSLAWRHWRDRPALAMRSGVAF